MKRLLAILFGGSFVCLGWAQEVHIPLNDGWSFCQVGKGEWYPAEVPGVVQTDLLRQGLIPDFMWGSNIDSVQWIENEDWTYKRNLFVDDTLLRHGHLDLVFKGLDTFAEVYVNDSLLGKADNMFRTWEWPVKALLRKGANELKVIFRSPIEEGAKLRDAYGIQLPHDNDPSGVSPYIRKAAYQFGWDFCPRLVTSGIWKEVELRGWSVGRIHGVDITHLFDSSGVIIRISPRVNVSDPDVDRACGMSVYFWANGPDKPPTVLGGQAQGGGSFRLETPNLWMTNDLGKPQFYKARAELTCNGEVSSVWDGNVGVRSISLDRSKDTLGASFAFVLNGKPLFVKGCNIIPPSLIPTVSDTAWVGLVEEMRVAGMNMARIWAGGLYPPDAFFHACDTAGILVWQDHLFGNMTPGDNAFMENAEQEAFEQRERLERHPSLALWCGNNELEVAWRHWGWQERYDLHGVDSSKVRMAYWDLFDEQEGYLHHSWHTPAYIPTSPLSNWGHAEGLTKGDLHYWGVWHGDSTFSSFKNNVGRFVSEYGFQSYPDSALLAKYIDPDSLYLGSPAVTRLQRSYKTDRPIWDAIERELGEEKPTTLGDFIEASQRAQAKAYGMAIEAHMKAQPYCMGTLLWQLNDCWPGPSWSIIDYEGKPKPAYEVVKDLYLSPGKQ